MSIEHEVGEFFSDPLDLPPSNPEVRGLLVEAIKILNLASSDQVYSQNDGHVCVTLAGGHDTLGNLSPGYIDMYYGNSNGNLLEFTYYGDLDAESEFFTKNLILVKLLENGDYSLTKYKLSVDKDEVHAKGIDLLSPNVATELQALEKDHYLLPDESESLENQKLLGLNQSSRRDLQNFIKIIQTSEVV